MLHTRTHANRFFLSRLSLAGLLFIVVLGGIVFSPLSPNRVSAVNECNGDKTVLGIPVWSKYLPHEETNGACRPVIRTNDAPNPDAPAGETAQGIENILLIGIAVLEIGITLAGLVAVVMVFIGAFRYLISTGTPDKTASAQKTVINALVGLVIVIVATRVTSFIASAIQ